MLDPDGKGWERPHPDLVTHDNPGLRTDQSQSGFPSQEGKIVMDDAFAGLLRVFWLEDKGTKS